MVNCNINGEIWKDIEGYEGKYQASSDGRIRNSKGKVLKTYTDKCGYQLIGLYKDGKSKTFRVHRIIYEALVGDIPIDLQINHKDFNRSNNKVSNLEVTTREENVRHSLQNTLRANAYDENGNRISKGNSKINREIAEEIRTIYATKDVTYKELAKIYGIKRSAVGNIVTGKSWPKLGR